MAVHKVHLKLVNVALQQPHVLSVTALQAAVVRLQAMTSEAKVSDCSYIWSGKKFNVVFKSFAIDIKKDWIKKTNVTQIPGFIILSDKYSKYTLKDGSAPSMNTAHQPITNCSTRSRCKSQSE